jgi:hypothetical protein
MRESTTARRHRRTACKPLVAVIKQGLGRLLHLPEASSFSAATRREEIRPRRTHHNQDENGSLSRVLGWLVLLA